MEIFWPADGGVGFALVGIVMGMRGSGGGKGGSKCYHTRRFRTL